MANLATRVRALRVSRGLTLAELAEMSDVPAPNLSRIESGKLDPRFSTAERIFSALGVDLVPARPTRRTLADVRQRSLRGRSRLARAGVASPEPWARLAWKAQKGEDIRDEAARLAEAAIERR